MLYEIIYPFPNFNGYTIDIWEWMGNIYLNGKCNYSSILGLNLVYICKRYPCCRQQDAMFVEFSMCKTECWPKEKTHAPPIQTGNLYRLYSEETVTVRNIKIELLWEVSEHDYQNISFRSQRVKCITSMVQQFTENAFVSLWWYLPIWMIQKICLVQHNPVCL